MSQLQSPIIRKFNLVKRLVEEIAPESVTNLNDGASDEEVAELRAVVPQAPPELFELLRLHDGEEMIAWTSLFPDGMQLMTVGHLLETARYRKSRPDDIEELALQEQAHPMIRRSGPVKPYFTHPNRIPFAHVNGELLWCFDLDPAEGGKVGQIIYDDAEGMALGVVAESFEDLLDKYLRDLKAGAFTADDDGQIVSAEGSWYAPKPDQ